MAASTLTGRNVFTVGDESGTASIAAAGDLFAIDVRGFEKISVQITSAGVGNTITFEVSDNNVDYTGIAGYASTAPATETVTTWATASGAVINVFRCDSRYFRARVSTYGSGTVTGTWFGTARV